MRNESAKALIFGKFHALRTLSQIYRLLSNWQEVWRSYRLSEPLPPLKFRRGFNLHHTKFDDPVMLMLEIFNKRTYQRHLESDVRTCAVDLGANIGMVTLDLASQLPDLHIHSYEPNPSTFETLSKNVEANGFSKNVFLHQEAVGAAQGSLEIWTNLPSDWATGTRYSAAAPAYDTQRSVGAVKVNVPQVALQTVLDRVPEKEVDLLKIDTEGAEVDILEAISPDGLRKARHIVLEYHEHLFPGALTRCRSAMEKAGFSCEHETFGKSVNGILYAVRH